MGLLFNLEWVFEDVYMSCGLRKTNPLLYRWLDLLTANFMKQKSIMLQTLPLGSASLITSIL